MEDKKVEINTEENILLSKYCVGCYPKCKRAMFTYNGDSLCEECFKQRLIK